MQGAVLSTQDWLPAKVFAATVSRKSVSPVGDGQNPQAWLPDSEKKSLVSRCEDCAQNSDVFQPLPFPAAANPKGRHGGIRTQRNTLHAGNPRLVFPVE